MKKMRGLTRSVVGWARLILDRGEASSLVGVIRMCFALVSGFRFVELVGGLVITDFFPKVFILIEH